MSKGAREGGGGWERGREGRGGGWERGREGGRKMGCQGRE